MAFQDDKFGVLCVEDNPHVAEALRLKLSRMSDFEWKGWIPAADSMLETAKATCPALMLLDLDMPGRDPLEAASELARCCPTTRIVVFSGHVRQDLVDRAIEVGAWGYVSKNDGEEALINALRSVCEGEVALSPEVRAVYNRN